MSITNAILGFLSSRPLTGYDLKKLVADSDILHWSGNSNQIYTALVALHREGLVTFETEQQENLPPRKTYTLTRAGRERLRGWLLSAPELPESRSPFLLQLAWADELTPSELGGLVAAYEEKVATRVALCRERIRRGHGGPDRTAREKYLWRKAHENRLRAWEAELAWTQDLRKGLARHGKGGAKGRGR
jgi:PadR family transcriptional regulator, regulatory protein AphA